MNVTSLWPVTCIFYSIPIYSKEATTDSQMWLNLHFIYSLILSPAAWAEYCHPEIHSKGHVSFTVLQGSYHSLLSHTVIHNLKWYLFYSCKRRYLLTYTNALFLSSHILTQMSFKSESWISSNLNSNLKKDMTKKGNFSLENYGRRYQEMLKRWSHTWFITRAPTGLFKI